VAPVAKEFDAVGPTYVAEAAFVAEHFFDDECNANTDGAGFLVTNFAWYDYDVGGAPVPKPGLTCLVRRPGGETFKLAVVSYRTDDEGVPDGPGAASGKYPLRLAPVAS
jgi:hypothetical protein